MHYSLLARCLHVEHICESNAHILRLRHRRLVRRVQIVLLAAASRLHVFTATIAPAAVSSIDDNSLFAARGQQSLLNHQFSPSFIGIGQLFRSSIKSTSRHAFATRIEVRKL